MNGGSWRSDQFFKINRRGHEWCRNCVYGTAHMFCVHIVVTWKPAFRKRVVEEGHFVNSAGHWIQKSLWLQPNCYFLMESWRAAQGWCRWLRVSPPATLNFKFKAVFSISEPAKLASTWLSVLTRAGLVPTGSGYRGQRSNRSDLVL